MSRASISNFDMGPVSVLLMITKSQCNVIKIELFPKGFSQNFVNKRRKFDASSHRKKKKPKKLTKNENQSELSFYKYITLNIEYAIFCGNYFLYCLLSVIEKTT